MSDLFNPEMLLLARESRGLSLGDVADASEIPKAILARYESGEVAPDEDAVMALATATKYAPAWFCKRAAVHRGVWTPRGANVWHYHCVRRAGYTVEVE